jgi:hypothetical protein
MILNNLDVNAGRRGVVDVVDDADDGTPASGRRRRRLAVGLESFVLFDVGNLERRSQSGSYDLTVVKSSQVKSSRVESSRVESSRVESSRV